MTRLLEFIAAVFIVTMVFLAIGCFLPSQRQVSKTVLTDRHLTIVYDTLNGFQHFKDWNAVGVQDRSVALRLSGPVRGQGAQVDLQSRQPLIGHVHWEIINSRRDSDALIRFAVQDPSFGQVKRLTFHLERRPSNPSQISVTATYNVDYGWNILGRYAGLYVRQSKSDELNVMLTRLLTFWGTIPNADYLASAGGGSALMHIGLADVPAAYLLIAPAGGVDRSEDEILQAVKDSQDWIHRVEAANHLIAGGPLRIITNDDSPSKYNFDVAEPIQPPPPSLAVSNESRAGGAVAAAASDSASREKPLQNPRLDLPNNAPVNLFYVKPLHVAHAHYSGPLSGLAQARNALRAWAVTSGYEVINRPYEDWLSGTGANLRTQGEYELYWEVK